MALADVKDLVRGARVALDENASSAPLAEIGDTDALSLDELILSKVEEAARLAHIQAPAHLLEDGHDFSDAAVYVDSLGRGWLRLPDDFMRLVCFQMSCWDRAVTQAITPEDPAYALQRSRWPGIGGTPQRPVCALCKKPEGTVLEFYKTAPGNEEIARAAYQPLPRIEAEKIDISPRLRRATEYMIAALTAASLGDAEKAQHLNQMATNAMT